LFELSDLGGECECCHVGTSDGWIGGLWVFWGGVVGRDEDIAPYGGLAVGTTNPPSGCACHLLWKRRLRGLGAFALNVAGSSRLWYAPVVCGRDDPAPTNHPMQVKSMPPGSFSPSKSLQKRHSLSHVSIRTSIFPFSYATQFRMIAPIVSRASLAVSCALLLTHLMSSNVKLLRRKSDFKWISQSVTVHFHKI